MLTVGATRLRLGTAGAAKLFVNGMPAGWLAPARRNAMEEAEFDVTLAEGENEISVWFEDLAERDAVVRVKLVWVAGPEAEAALPYDAPGATVHAVDDAIAAMHLDAKHYDNAEIRLVLPVPFPGPVEGQVTVAGDFMAHGAQSFPLRIPAGANSVRLCHSSALRPNNLCFQLALACEGFATEATLGAEITNLPPSARSRASGVPISKQASVVSVSSSPWAAIQPRAQIWINHPGEVKQSGFGRPSFWGGSASVPQVQQYRDLAIALFDGDVSQLDFAHAWFPTPAFDD